MLIYLFIYLFIIWFDAMAAYKQIMPRLTTALTGMQKYKSLTVVKSANYAE